MDFDFLGVIPVKLDPQGANQMSLGIVIHGTKRVVDRFWPCLFTSWSKCLLRHGIMSYWPSIIGIFSSRVAAHRMLLNWLSQVLFSQSEFLGVQRYGGLLVKMMTFATTGCWTTLLIWEEAWHHSCIVTILTFLDRLVLLFDRWVTNRISI